MSKVIIVTYDISDNKIRRRFSKYLERYGVRVQFSVFEIENSKRILDIVQNAIDTKYKKMFEPGDSIYLFLAEKENTKRYGSASFLDNDLIFI